MFVVLSAPVLRGDTVSDLTPKAEAGDLVAQVELGKIYANGEGVAKSPKDAIKWYSLAAEQGSVEAQLFLGQTYFLGKVVPKSSTESAKWYLQAAEQGNAAAQCQVARMHMMGAGIPKDDVEAYKWASLAAAQGDAASKKVMMVLDKRMDRDQVSLALELAKTVTEDKKADESPKEQAPALEPIKPEILEPAGN